MEENVSQEASQEARTVSKKSIYWPSVASMINRPAVAAAVLACCMRVGVEIATECEEENDSFGNEHSVLDALSTIEAGNADGDDKLGLSKCLFLVNLAKAENPDKKDPEADSRVLS